MNNQVIIRLPEVIKRTGLSRSTIYLRLKDNQFPKPIPLGARAIGWLEEDVDSWIDSCVKNKEKGGI